MMLPNSNHEGADTHSNDDYDDYDCDYYYYYESDNDEDIVHYCIQSSQIAALISNNYFIRRQSLVKQENYRQYWHRNTPFIPTANAEDDDSSIELNNSVNEGADSDFDDKESYRYWHHEVEEDIIAIPVDEASTGAEQDADNEVDEASTGEDTSYEVDEASTGEDADNEVGEASTGEDINNSESNNKHEINDTDDSLIELNSSVNEGADRGADSNNENHKDEDLNWSGNSDDNNSNDDEDDEAGTYPEVPPPIEASDHSHSPEHNYSLRNCSNLNNRSIMNTTNILNNMISISWQEACWDIMFQHYDLTLYTRRSQINKMTKRNTSLDIHQSDDR